MIDLQEFADEQETAERCHDAEVARAMAAAWNERVRELVQHMRSRLKVLDDV